ncbi:hypothetical protein LRZ95_00060 [Candidatus Gracilibacteria bacterium]|nr:hypothetical protein [Candidatus Gracilibacteria bacterium]
MSNRILGILILLGFLGIGYLYYIFNYIPELKQRELEKQKVEKELILKKEAEKKKIKLIKIENNVVVDTKEQKIKKLRENIKNYKTFRFDDNIIYFKKSDINSLNMYYNSVNIGKFKLVYKNYLFVNKVYGGNGDLFISVGKDKYIYNKNLRVLKKIDLNIKVLYVKKDGNNYIFVTDKGSFIYNFLNNKLEYFSFFNDFIYFDNLYIGLISPTEKQLINNLGLKNINNDILYLYNPKTKEKKILFNFDFDISKIYKVNDKVYVESNDGNKYIILNLKKNLK